MYRRLFIAEVSGRVSEHVRPCYAATARHEDVAYALTLPKGHPLRFTILYGSNPSDLLERKLRGC